MSENQATVRYSFRLRPGSLAETRLILEWNCARWVWNQCVEAGNASYKAFKEGVECKSPTLCRMSKKLTQWRSDLEWLREGSQCVQQQAIRKWYEAYRRAFKQSSVGFPKFKCSKTSLPSLEYTVNGFRIKDDHLCIAGGISIPVVWSRALPSDPRSCVVTRDCEGHWNVSFVVRRNKETFPPSEDAIGIDWGVKTVATTTNPDFDLPHGNQTALNADRLKWAQRKLARAKNGSNGRSKAKKHVARIHVKAARQRKDRAFKWARKVVMSFGRIAVEDFQPKFLAASTMAKKSADGAVGITKRILLTLADTAGRTVALVPPFFTTMTCGECGSRNKTRLTLSQRTFVCDSCGHTADRDRNAAQTICVRAGFNPADIDDVRPMHDLGCASAV